MPAAFAGLGRAVMRPGGPTGQEVHRAKDLPDRIGCQSVEFDVLAAGCAGVTRPELPAVPREGVHVVQPPEGRHDDQPVAGYVVGDQRKGQRHVEAGGVVALGQQHIRGEPAVVLETHAKPRPEPATRDDLPVGGAGVVVGPDRCPGSNVALAADRRGDQERVVVVLLVGRKNQAADDLATGDGGIVAYEAVAHPGAELQRGAPAENHPPGLDAREHLPARLHDDIHQRDALPDLHRLIGDTLQRHVLQAIGPDHHRPRPEIHPSKRAARNNRCAPPNATSTAHRAAGVVGPGDQSTQDLAAVASAGPQRSPGGEHPRASEDPPASVFVGDLDPWAVIVVAVAVGASPAVAERSLAPAGHHADIQQQRLVGDLAAGYQGCPMDHHIVTQGAVFERGVGQAGRQRKPPPRPPGLQRADAHLSPEGAPADAGGVETVADTQGRPVVRDAALPDQPGNFLVGQPAMLAGWFGVSTAWTHRSLSGNRLWNPNVSVGIWGPARNGMPCQLIGTGAFAT